MPDDRMKLQRDEFDAFDAFVALYKAYSALPAVVDDDYPEMRHYYESRLKNFIDALRANRPDQMGAK